MNPTPARLGYVDGLRALAALQVMLAHMTEAVLSPGLQRGALAILVPMLLGHVAVAVFIVLSGFSLMLPVAPNANRLPWGAIGFYRRRARRILPPYYVALFLSLALIVAGITRHNDLSAATLVQHLLLIQDFSPSNPGAIDAPLWSVALECQIYLFFPALVWLWRRHHPVFIAVMSVLLSCLAAVALTPTAIGRTPGYLISSFAPQFLGLFALGMLAATWVTRSDAQPSRWIWAALTLLSVGVIAATVSQIGMAALDILVGLGALGLLLTSSHPSALRAVLEWRPLVWIGGFSYSFYLIHAPLIQLLWQYVFHPLGLGDVATYLLLLGVGGPLIVLAAWGFWWLCERPFLNSRVASPRRESGAAVAGAR